MSPPTAHADQGHETAAPPRSKILVVIDKPTQELTVFVDDVERYTWKVSTGLPGYATPSGNYTATSMNEIWYSKEWDNAPMPHAVFFTKKGHAIHGTHETNKLGKPASHGCVRLAPENARMLFALIEEQGLENTGIILNGDTPGGELKVASPKPPKKAKRAKKADYSSLARRELKKWRRFARKEWFERRFRMPPREFYAYPGPRKSSVASAH